MSRPRPDPSPAPRPRAAALLHGPWTAALLGLLCMANSLRNGLTYDDVAIVRDNSRIRSLANFRGIWLSNWWHEDDVPPEINERQEPLYRPLTLFTFALNYAATGLWAPGFHLANVLLHAAACILVWHFLRRLLSDDAVAGVAAVLFAVHPVHAEAVAGIVGRAEILAAVFLLLGLLALLPRDRLPGPGRTAASALLFLLALLAKETAICYPAVALLALQARPAARARPARWWLARTAILLAPLLVYFPVRYAALAGKLFRPEPAGVWMNPLVMASGLERVAGALTVLGHYTRLMLVPATLSCDYGLAIIDPRRGFAPLALVGLLAAAGLVAALAGFRRPAGLGRQLATLAALTLASYALISNTVLLIGVSVAERLMYWPSVPILGLLAALLVGLWRRHCGPGGALAGRARLLRGLGLAIVAALGLRTAVRNADWVDNLTLITRDLAAYPQGAHLHKGRALELVNLVPQLSDPAEQRRLLEIADRHLAEALRIDPAFGDALALRARVCAALGRADEALGYANAALLLAPHHRDALRALAQLRGGIDAVERDLAEARARVAEQPDSRARRLDLAAKLLEYGEAGKARDELEPLVAAAPDDPRALRLLAEALALLGRRERASALLLRVLELEPDDWTAHANLSSLLSQDEPAAALRHARRAYELQPDDVRVAVNLAEACEINGRYAEALALLRQIERRLAQDDPFRLVIGERIRELQRR